MEQYQTDGQRVGLNAWQLKLIAIVAMVIDHLAFSFVPDGTFLAVAMHFIGRITGPTMFYFAVEGYHHTRDLKRYILRLVIFAGISYFPFLLFHAGGDVGSLNPLRLNVIYTILLGVLAVTVRHHVKNSVLKLLLILLLFTLGMLGDWAIYGIIIILVFFLSRRFPQSGSWLRADNPPGRGCAPYLDKPIPVADLFGGVQPEFGNLPVLPFG